MPMVREAAAVLIAEPTSLCPAYREKGVFRFKLITKGKAAHASQPWLGENAILKMHYCLARLSDLAAISNERTTGMTTCISTIEGGTKSNVVPDSCKTEIDIRFPLPQTPEDINVIITNRLRGLEYDIDVDYTLEAFEADPSSPLVGEMVKFLGTEPVVVPYATEAPKFAAVNKNVYICGPGDPKMAHTVDENVGIVELQQAYRFFEHMAKISQG
jgi:acetylornithine deacetylase/succinyl-diaminopimelate desuccinylase-like protein